MAVIDVKDPELYVDWTIEQLDEHLAELRKIRDAKSGSPGFPNRKTFKELLDPEGDNFCGSGLTMPEFLLTMDMQRLHTSFYRQMRPERNRRLNYIVKLAKVLAQIEARSIQATGLARGAIENVIDGDWFGVRQCSKDFREEEVEFFGVRDPELQALWTQFADLLQEAFDTRPEAPLPPTKTKH